MRVLVACEFSGIVRDAFIRRGHQAISCDIIDTESEGPHHTGDALTFINDNPGAFDLMIAHPPCDYLSVAGARWLYEKPGRLELRDKAVDFARTLWEAPIPRICMENPVSMLATLLCKPTQYIHPYEYGHGEQKKTALWLKNLPNLTPTKHVEGREQRVWLEPPGPDRKKNRSRTYPGIAEAMASQWGAL